MEWDKASQFNFILYANLLKSICIFHCFFSTFADKFFLLKILVLSPAPNNISPSQRFRFEHFIGKKNNQDIEFVQKPFFNLATWKVLHQQKNYFQKSFGILIGIIKRFLLLFTVFKYDFVFIHREAAPVGPPILEWVIAKVFRKKIIYDFDDAIWISTSSAANPTAAKIKSTWKVKKICSYSKIISVGNEFLADYAKQFNNDVRIIPTVVDTNLIHNRLKNHQDQPLTIGWTGTFTNFYNLDMVVGVVNELKKKYAFRFLIIADKDPQLQGINYDFKKWDINTEIDDLIQIHIGIMPLKNTEIEQGKCAFKAIQYMSLGIPPVVSPVGANKKLVTDCANGFLVESEEDWYNKLEVLISNADTRVQIGNNARNRIVSNYSVQAVEKSFFQLFAQ